MKVLLIREEGSSERTKVKLKDFNVVIKPLFKIENIYSMANNKTFDYALITSKNAQPFLKHFNFKQLIQIDEQYKDAKDLLKLIKTLKGSILYVRGEKISYNFKKAHSGIEEAICYRLLPTKIELDIEEFDVVLLYSVNFSKRFLEVLKGDCKNKIAVCISQKVADIVKDKMQTVVAQLPNENSMIEELCKIK